MARWTYKLPLRLRSLFRRSRVEKELDEELRYHLENEIQQYIAQGMAPEEARYAALRELGGVEQHKEECRDARGLRWLDELGQDLRYSLRGIRRSPGFAAMALVTLAVGIGANAAVFGLVDRLLLRSLPVKAPQELLALTWGYRADNANNQFSYPEYRAYCDENEVFSGLLAFSNESLSIGVGDQRPTVRGALVSTNYFDMLGVDAAIGRVLLPEEKVPAVVISYGLWQRWFGSSPDAVGRTMTINQASYVVVGVARKGFNGAYADRATEIWVPLAMRAGVRPDDRNTDRPTYHWLNVWGRLKPGISMVQAQTAMNVLLKRVVNPAYAAGYRAARHRELQLSLEPVGRGLSFLRQNLERPLALLMVVVGLILLIACINISSLLLARTISRRREMAIRRALGAPRIRLIVQLLMEGVILCICGGVAGILLAQWITRLWIASQPNIDLATSPLAATPDGRILLFALLVSAVAGLISGSAAALHCSKPDLTTALKGDRAGLTHGVRRYGLRHAMVGIEIALAVVVLLGAGLLIRNLLHLFAIDPAMNDVFLVRVDLPGADSIAHNGDLYLRVAERLKHLPGIEAVSAANIIPFGGASAGRSIWPEGYESQSDVIPSADYNLVGPGYHELIGTPILQGRGFAESDRAGSPPVAIINLAFARLYFPGQNPIGKKLWSSRSRSSACYEIVGVAGDRKYHSLREPAIPHIDLPVLQDNGTPGTLCLRTSHRGEHLLSAIQGELSAVDPRIKLGKTSTLAEMLSDSIATDRMLTILTTVLAVIAFSIVVVGIYALIAHSLNQRTRELGIRIALGAPSRNVRMLLLREGGGVAITGLAAGLLVYLALARFISSLLFEISPMDPPALAFVSLLVIFIALLASYIPGRRAGGIDPIKVLRCE